jgi:hypothetical protein
MRQTLALKQRQGIVASTSIVMCVAEATVDKITLGESRFLVLLDNGSSLSGSPLPDIPLYGEPPAAVLPTAAFFVFGSTHTDGKRAEAVVLPP